MGFKMETKTATITQLDEMLSHLLANSDKEFTEMLLACEADDRAGVKRLAKKYRQAKEKQEAEIKRLYKMREYERQYQAHTYIAGMDEAGRGPLAGPVVACAVILPNGLSISGVDDSKKLTPKKREELYSQILEQAVCYGVGIVSAARIDEINILNATYEAMKKAVAALNPAPEILLNDAVKVPGIHIPQVPIIKGDAKSITIAAASIVAKVSRDRIMEEYALTYPGYGFEANKGYGSEQHIKALKELGPSPIHRRSFIRNFED